MIAVRGAGSVIVARLLEMLPGDEVVVPVSRGADMPLDADRYLFCQGLMRPLPVNLQSNADMEESLSVNLWQVEEQCDRILANNHKARICVIGSESGYSGSLDGNYASSKALLHRYVEIKKIRPGQQLVCLAPTIIEDAGMTTRRTDIDNLNDRRQKHPKRRFLQSVEVARLIHFCLYVDEGFLSGVVIRMHGGMPAWRGLQ